MDGFIVNPDICPICKNLFEHGEEIVAIQKKGANSLNCASNQRGDNIVVEVGDKVHSTCRAKYVNARNIKQHCKKNCEPSNILKRTTRACADSFNSKTDCFFCGINVRGNSNSSHVKTDNITKTILKRCANHSDDWTLIVKSRIEYYGHDLHAADSLYHRQCYINFITGYDIPLQFQSEPMAKLKKTGRPRDNDKDIAFLMVCSYLENNDEEQLTISDLSAKMKEFLTDENADPYGNHYLKNLLKKHYGDTIYIAEENGQPDIVTLREKATQILRSYLNSWKLDADEESQKKAIIETAAKLIKSDIKTNVSSDTDNYPSTHTLTLNSAQLYMPCSLQLLLNTLFVGKDTQQKVASIGQSIIQAVRPRAVLAPLQIGLAVQIHHLTRSKFIVDTLSEMGFCASYKEVLRFEKNAANCVAPDMLGEDIDPSSTALLFVGDNVDHNIITIDGKGTFHGMGMIAALTPKKQTNRIIPRLNISELNITEKIKIEIKELPFIKNVCLNIKFLDLPKPIGCNSNIDILWELSFSYKQPVSNWQGMMHTIHHGNVHPGQSSVIFLPMIDMYSGDKACILSTLDFLSNLAIKHDVSPIITFDQPLYWKAAELIFNAPQSSQLKSIVLMLGSFHTFMNLLGAIGTLMDGTGLKSILEEVYGENAVVHMMTGKSVQRSFRGHLLVDKCLNNIIVSDIMDTYQEFSSLVDQAEKIYNSLMTREVSLESIASSDTLGKIKETIDIRKEELSGRSKTSQLWLNYQRMLQIARTLIKADRMGCWQLHLNAVSACLPIFAAAGHYNYLKSAYLYLQEMRELHIKHPEVHIKFERGFHVIRRSDHFWAGLGSDLVIEQTLMKSLKSTGGLTHGSGMTEEQRSQWTMSVPITAEYNNAMQEFNNLAYTTSDQHKESTNSRIKRDFSDFSKIHSKLVASTPFSSDPSLRNIVNGIVAKDDVNAHDYEAVGDKIIAKMIGQPVYSFSFKRKDKAKTLGDVSAIKVAPGQSIVPALLFQRFLVVSQTRDLNLQEVMNYELSPFPPTLFEAANLLRKAEKPQLAHAIVDHCKKELNEAIMDTKPETEHYILDGGSLLHRLPWKKGATYGMIAQTYADFTIHNYGLATVVFDGYEGGPSIKDNTHQRRGQNIHPVVNFTAETEFSGKKEDFLSRDCNKQHFINLISVELKKRGCNVIQALGDADVDIVKAAVDAANFQSVALIGEDTDLLVLLLFHAKVACKNLYFYSDTQSKEPKIYHINCMKALLGNELCAQLLFIHAFTGCDTTSRIFGIGKKSVFQKLINRDPVLQSCANTFVLPDQSCETITELGNQAMAVIFGGKCDDSLSLLRYNSFSKKVAVAKSFVTPERLPPTSSSTRFHSLRVYYQIMVWIGRECGMDSLKWGWKLEANQLVPVMSVMKAAPETLLKMIHCNCSKSCSTNRCSCRAYGLPCTAACGSCQLETCDNPSQVECDIDE